MTPRTCRLSLPPAPKSKSAARFCIIRPLHSHREEGSVWRELGVGVWIFGCAALRRSTSADAPAAKRKIATDDAPPVKKGKVTPKPSARKAKLVPKEKKSKRKRPVSDDEEVGLSQSLEGNPILAQTINETEGMTILCTSIPTD